MRVVTASCLIGFETGRRRRPAIVLSLSNDTNAMSGVHRNQPTSTGGTTTDPSPCETPRCYRTLSDLLTTRGSQETTVQ